MEIFKAIGIVIVMALLATLIFSFFGFFILFFIVIAVLAAALNLLGVPISIKKNDVLVGHIIRFKFVPLK